MKTKSAYETQFGAHASYSTRRAVTFACCLGLFAPIAHAAVTDLSNIPLVNATSVAVLPNIMFILDDSGSMGWEYMPDVAKTSGYWMTPHCNGLAYNPAVVYGKPPSLGTAAFADASFVAAKNDGYVAGSATTNLTGRYYYSYTGAEPDLAFTYDAASNVETGTNFYKECNSGPLSTKITVGGGGGKSYVVSSIKVNGVEIMSGPTATSNNTGTVASRIAALITQAGYSATVSGSQVTVYSDVAAAGGKTPVVTSSSSGSGSTMTFAANTFPAASTQVGVGKFTKVPVGAAEQTNYANWYSYYRNRLNMAKSSVGYAFQNVRGWPLDTALYPSDADYFHARLGFTTISEQTTTPGAKYLPIADFNSPVNTAVGHADNNQRKNFYDRLYGATANSGTPLRGALTKAGRLYAGKGSDDPIQYSCQKNFTILTTDGYWNTGNESASYTALDMNNNALGDVDGVSGVNNPLPTVAAPNPSYDAVHSVGSLADIAYYYYHTDLRPAMTNNVRPAVADRTSKIEDVAAWQHMTTFTIGMGVSGRVSYQDGYKAQTAASANHQYYDISIGAAQWPDPKVTSGTSQVVERVDDLWHAAVNGRGEFFSAKNPQALQAGIKKALGTIAGSGGSGSAAGTSSLAPTSFDDKAFVAGYNTGDWSGDVKAYNITNLSTGALSTTPTWSASAKLLARIPSPGNAESPARKIYTGASAFKDFAWATLTATEKSFFVKSFSPTSDTWTAAQTAANTGENLLNYLRGKYNYEVRSGATQQLYRNRTSILGDIIHSQPVSVKKPPYSFADTGYSDFKSAQDTRAGAVYVGSNDGMLHAFDSETGEENWAYVPPMVLPNLWRLAETNYASKHQYFVNGPLSVSDAYLGGSWKTVLVSAMGKGGRGYFAVDITSPSAPKLLWNFTADTAVGTSSDVNIGYTYGTPIIAKLGNGTWVAVVTSGYNNVPEAAAYPGAPTYSGSTGKGYVYVIDLETGARLKTFPTTVGTTSNPSGLTKINVMTNNLTIDNTAVRAYAGDLEGNMWRFDLDAADGVAATKLFAGSANQPITTAPEIGLVNGKKVVFFGTGRYLGQSDLADASPKTQAIYAIKDDGTTTISLAEIGTKLVQQTLSGGSISKNPVDWISKYGWYVNLTDGLGTRVAVNPQLHLGTLLIAATTPPDPTNPDLYACSPGGTGFLYQLDYATGGYVCGKLSCSNTAATSLSSPPVGMSGAQLPYSTGSSPVIRVIGADGNETKVDMRVGNSGGISGTKAKRVLWRELSN